MMATARKADNNWHQRCLSSVSNKNGALLINDVIKTSPNQRSVFIGGTTGVDGSLELWETTEGAKRTLTMLRNQEASTGLVMCSQ